MSISVLSKRYAKAIFDLALEAKSLEKVESDLISIKGLLESSADFNKIVNSPIVSDAAQNAVLEEVLKKMKVQVLTKRFVLVLIENGRLDILQSAIDAYSQMLKSHKGEVSAEVISARALTKKQTSQIEKTLGKSLGNKVQVTSDVDEEILGGIMIKIGSKMLDASVRGKLDKLQIITKNAIASC